MNSRISRYFYGIRATILITISTTLLLFFSGYILFQFLNSKQIIIAKKIQNQEVKLQVNSIIQLKTDFLNSIVIDYSCFDWMIDFLKQNPQLPYKIQPQVAITDSKKLKISFFQAFNLNGQVMYANNPDLIKEDTIKFDKQFFKRLYTLKTLIFFMKTKDGILEIHASTVHRSADYNHITPPQGFMMIGRLWNKTYLSDLSKIANATLFIDSNNNNKLYQDSINQPEIFVFKDFDDRQIGNIHFTKQNLFEETVSDHQKYLNAFFIFLFLSILVLSIQTFETQTIKPLTIIEQALEMENPSILEPIIKKNNEFSVIAKLMVKYYEQVEVNYKKIFELQKAQEELNIINNELLLQKSKIELQKEELQTQAENIDDVSKEYLQQKLLVEEVHKQLTDGISYASMIQQAVIEPQFDLSQAFKEQFIVFRPKDIVSGDFYWFKECHDKYLFACADSTGHGLSGALMSMIGISFLNEISNAMSQMQNPSTGSLLDELRLKIVDTLHQTGVVGQIRDGMDIVVCCYKKATHTLDFSAANHSLYYVSKDTEQKPMLTEFKGDRMPVGIYDKNDNFSNHTINLKEGDAVYIFSDGFIDQFGQETKKKYNKVNFKKLIVSLHNYSFEKQGEIIEKEFDEWKGTLEQIDDVTVIGIKF